MGFYLRKSIKAGPFRFNLSKSGLGVSAGVPGFRVGTGPRGNYVHMGRGGIYYRASLGGGQRGSSSAPPQRAPAYPGRIPAYRPSGILMEDTTGSTAVALDPTGPDDLVEQLNTAAGRFTWWWPTAIAGAVIALAVKGILGVAIAALFIPACLWLYFNDQARCTVVLFYEGDDDAAQWFQAVLNQWTWLGYEHLTVAPTSVRFIESDAPSADATMVDTTWRYVNKDGGPDRRFNDNRQLLVMLYGRVALTTATGLYWIIQISRHQGAEPVAQVISLGSQYADQIRRTQNRAISLDDAQIAACADQQNRLYLSGDTQGVYGQYRPAPLDEATDQPPPASSSKLELVSQSGKPRQWPEHADRDQVMIQLDIRPIVPDTRWWACFAKLVAERHMTVKLGEIARGGIATSAANSAAVPAAIAAIDAVIDDANAVFIDTYAHDEVESYVEQRLSAQRAQAAARAQLDLESLAELLAKPESE